MALPCALGLGTLMALPGALGSGSSNNGSENSNLTTIVLLLVLLLLLVTGLALAWRRLSRDSGGYYHPVRLGAALWGHTRRLVWGSPPGRWLRARVETVWLNTDTEQPEEEDAEDDYVMDGSRGSAESQEEEQQCGVGPRPEPKPADEVHDSDGEGGPGLSTQGPACAGGSAEALLSDLHAFAGSAAWDDSAAGAVGGQGPHVTAL